MRPSVVCLLIVSLLPPVPGSAQSPQNRECFPQIQACPQQPSYVPQNSGGGWGGGNEAAIIGGIIDIGVGLATMAAQQAQERAERQPAADTPSPERRTFVHREAAARRRFDNTVAQVDQALTIEGYMDEMREIDSGAKGAVRHFFNGVSNHVRHSMLSNFISTTFGGDMSDNRTIRNLSDTAAELMVEGRMGYTNIRERAGSVKETVKAEIMSMFEDFKSQANGIFED